jgi:predicted nucleic acid-binding protein
VGAEELTSAVADAGPLIHLSEIGGLALLRIFETLHIPDAVWMETVEQGRVARQDIVGLRSVRRHTLPQSDVSRFTQENGLNALHDGERECLCLCTQSGVSILLTDDLAVREAAKRLNFTPVGSLGIVIKAYQLGRVSLTDAESHMTDLYDVSSLFVTKVIVELAIERLRGYSGRG